MHPMQATDRDDRRSAGEPVIYLRNLPLAAALVLGVLLFAFGASRLVTTPANNVADHIRSHAAQIQTAESTYR
jgi:hypothetical protein